MREFFQKLKNKVVAWHQVTETRSGDPAILQKTGLDLVYYATLVLFLYSVSVFGLMGIVGFLSKNSIGVFVDIALAIVLVYGLRRLIIKQFLGEKVTTTRRLKLHSFEVIVVLTLEIFISYLLVSALVPHTALLSKTTVYTFVTQGNFVYMTGLVFIFIQPFVEGLIVRGYLTELATRHMGKPNKYVAFWLPVVVGTLIHGLGSLTLPVLFFGFYQAIMYQLIAKKQGLLISIWTNMAINILIFSLL